MTHANRYKRIAIGLAGALATLLCACERPAEKIIVTPSDQVPIMTRTISVSGKARVEAIPDRFVIVFGVEEHASSPSAAASAVDAKIGAILELTAKRGIKNEDMATDNFSLQPKYDHHRSRVVTGYEASRRVTVVLKSPEEVSTYLPEIFEAGANTLYDVRFESTKIIELRHDAQLRALQAARDKASRMAEALDQKIGAPQTIQEHRSSFQAPQFGNAYIPSSDSASVTQSIAAGQIEVSASVDVIFELAD